MDYGARLSHTVNSSTRVEYLFILKVALLRRSDKQREKDACFYLLFISICGSHRGWWLFNEIFTYVVVPYKMNKTNGIEKVDYLGAQAYEVQKRVNCVTLHMSKDRQSHRN